MSLTKHYPESLKELLATTPLVHLVPRQHLAPLVNLTQIAAKPDSKAFVEGAYKEFDGFHGELAKQFEKECHDELLAFLDDDDDDDDGIDGGNGGSEERDRGGKGGELDNIRFKMPKHAEETSDSPQEPPVELDYTEFEKKVLAREKLTKTNCCWENEEKVYGESIYTRRNHEFDSLEDIELHKKKYFKLFETEVAKETKGNQELVEVVSQSQTVESLDETLDAIYKSKQPESFHGSQKSQRSERIDMLETQEIPTTIHIPLQSSNQETRKSNITKTFNFFTSLNQDEITWENLAQLNDTLAKLQNFTEKNDQHDLLKVQDMCLVNLRQTLEKLKPTLLSKYDEFVLVLPDLLRLLFSINSLLLILKVQPDIRNKHTDLVIMGLELSYENFTKPLDDTFFASNHELAEEPNSISLKCHMIIDETSKAFKNLGSICAKRPFDDESLVKLQLLLINIAVPSSQDQIKVLVDRTQVPLEPIQLSSYSCLLIIYHNLEDQRAFVVSEVLSHISILPTSRNFTRKFKIERGFQVQTFTILLITFVHCSENHMAFADYITLEILRQMEENPSNTKRTEQLENYLEDLWKLLLFPEWVGAQILLISFLHKALDTLTKPETEEENKSTELPLFDILIPLSEKILSHGESIEKNTTVEEQHLEIILSNCLGFDRNFAFECLKSRIGKVNEDVIMADEREEIKPSRDSVPKVYIRIVLQQLRSILLSNYATFIQTLLSSLKAKIRSKAIKALPILIDTFPGILSSSEMQKALALRLEDPASVVRDAMNEFIGKYMQSHPEESEKLIAPLLKAMDDPRTTVRKKSMRSCLNVYPQLNEHYKLVISVKYFERLLDEADSIRGEAKECLLKCFFTQGEEDFNGLSKWIKIVHRKNSDFLRSFFVESVFSNPKLNEVVLNYVEKALGTVSYEKEEVEREQENENENEKEKTDRIGDDGAGSTAGAGTGNSTKSGAIEEADSLLLLAAFVVLKPTLITQAMLEHLKPYIFEHAGSRTEAYCYALQVLKIGTHTLRAFKPNFVEEITNFLLRKMPMFIKRELDNVVPTLNVLTKYSHTEYKIVNIVITTMKMIRKEFESTDAMKVNTLLQLLSYLGKYCELQSLDPQFREMGFIKPNESIITLIVRYIMTFTGQRVTLPIRRVAYPSMMICLASYPLYLQNESISKIFEAALVLEQDLELKKRMVGEFITFLDENGRGENEQNPKQNNAQAREVEISTFRVQANLRHRACLYLAQKFFKTIAQLCLLDDGIMDLKPLQFVRLALNLGVANPIACLSVLIALHGSPIPQVQNTANEVLTNYGKLVDGQFLEGIKQAFQYKLLAPRMFKLIYKVVEDSKQMRNKFIKSLTKMLVVRQRHRASFEDEIKLLVFVVERITPMHFKTIEEVFIIMEHLQGLLQSQASDFIFEMGQQVNIDKNYAYYWALSIVLLNDFYKYLAHSYNIKDEDVEAFSTRCLETDLNQTPRLVRGGKMRLKWVLGNIGVEGEILNSNFEICLREIEQICMIYRSELT